MPRSHVTKSESYVLIKLDTSEYLLDHAQYGALLDAIRQNPPSNVVWMGVLEEEYAPKDEDSRNAMVRELDDYTADTIMHYVEEVA